MKPRDDLKGVGGWLGWLVFSMCVLGPLISFGSFYAQIGQAERANPILLKMPEWADYTQLATIVQVTAVTCLFLGGFFLWTRFKRSTVYIAIAALWLANVGLALGHHAAMAHVFPQLMNDSTSGELAVAVFRAVLIAFVWTLYLLLSRRVKNTYLRPDLAADTATSSVPPVAEPEPTNHDPRVASDRIAEIERLQVLHDSGALTRAEFDSEKQRVLSQ